MRTEISPMEAYLLTTLKRESAEKQKARALSEELGLAMISISPPEANVIQFLAQLIRPQKIVEIGTLTGLSCLYFLETLQHDGCVWTFEKSDEHIAKAQIALAPHLASGRCKIVAGDALEKLPTINSEGPFDLVFIDGNKAAYYDYWKWAEVNIRSGGMILIDNLFLAGSVWGDNSKQRFNEKQIANVKKMTIEITSSENFYSAIVPTSEGLLLASKK